MIRIRRAALVIVAVALTVGGVLWLRPGPRVAGPLPQQAYVWQRAWNEPVRRSVSGHATNFAALVVLHAEVSFAANEPRVTRVALPWAELRHATVPVGLALRIGPYRGPFAVEDATTRWLTGLTRSLLAEARSNHCSVAELQVDFDCADSKLAGYRIWIEAIRRVSVPVPVTLTALPSWVNQRAFVPLARASDGFVLQVHSLDPPRGVNASFTLCDPEAASRAVDRAARAGVPFRVALPTYGYHLAFDRGGKFIGLSAEGPRRYWPKGAVVREVMADPAMMAGLVDRFTRDRPLPLRGIIWYRLPVAGDVLNWQWPTLASVMAGKIPHARLTPVARKENAPLVEIELHNDGDRDYTGNVRVLARSAHARVIASDAVQGFESRSPSNREIQFGCAGVRLPAGGRRVIGWIRLERDAEIMLELTSD